MIRRTLALLVIAVLVLHGIKLFTSIGSDIKAATDVACRGQQ